MMQKNQIKDLSENEKKILQLLRRKGKNTKADLAKEASLTSATVGYIISALQDLDLVRSGDTVKSGQPGHPTTHFHLNPNGAYSVGVRLDRNCIKTVLINFDGNMLSKITHEIILPAPEETLEMVSKDVKTVLATLANSERDKLIGMGLAKPFSLGDCLKNLDGINYDPSGWYDFDFAKAREEKTGIKVDQESDGTAAAIAEYFFGVGRKFNDFTHIFFGPDISGGLVVNGNVVRGTTGKAADIGLIPTQPSKLTYSKNSDEEWDILLNRASLSSLRKHIQQFIPDENIQTCSELDHAIRNNTALVDEWIDDCVDALVPALLGAQAIIDFRVFIISATVGDYLTNEISKKLKEKLAESLHESRLAPKIVFGTFGEDAGAIGAACTPLFYSFSTKRN